MDSNARQTSRDRETTVQERVNTTVLKHFFCLKDVEYFIIKWECRTHSCAVMYGTQPFENCNFPFGALTATKICWAGGEKSLVKLRNQRRGRKPFPAIKGWGFTTSHTFLTLSATRPAEAELFLIGITCIMSQMAALHWAEFKLHWQRFSFFRNLEHT